MNLTRLTEEEMDMSETTVAATRGKREDITCTGA